MPLASLHQQLRSRLIAMRRLSTSVITAAAYSHFRRFLRRTGILKIGKTLGVGTALVQRVVMEQPRPFDVDAAEAALASQ
jgi:hypothetical protein